MTEKELLIVKSEGRLQKMIERDFPPILIKLEMDHLLRLMSAAGKPARA